MLDTDSHINLSIQKSKSGFTIVELLIVVVVIAILAAITIVAYNGIQKRAQTVTYATAANQSQNQLSILKTTNELPELYSGIGFPGQPGELPGTICLGYEEDFPATPDLAAGECRRTTNSSNGVVDSIRTNSTFINRMRLAKIQTPKNLATIKVSTNEQIVVSRGIVLHGIVGVPLYLSWIAPDMSSCGRGQSVIQSFIKQIEADPASLAQVKSTYGENWRTALFSNAESCLIDLSDIQ